MRATTTAQDEVLASLERATHVRVKLEDPDGNMVTVADLRGIDWQDEIRIEVSTEPIISRAVIRLWRSVDLLSMAPLIEGSEINRDAAGSYAPFINPNRMVTIETATLFPGQLVQESDYVMVWEGLSGPIDWGGAGNFIVIDALDPVTRLNRTFIPTVAAYGDGGGTEDAEDVMQEILDDNFGASAIPLTYSATSFPIDEYDLGNVTVLEALKAIIDLIGWNLHWRWDSGNSEFRLTLWEPARSNTTAAYTFGAAEIYGILRVGLDDQGIRNDGEIVYTDSSGAIGFVNDTRSGSVAKYEERFIRIDARDTSVKTSGQADQLLSNILDDLEEPSVTQVAEVPYFFPVELGDLYAFSPNKYYDTEQKLAVVSFTHTLTADKKRTTLELAGKASGGYARWHVLENWSLVRLSQRRTPVVAMQVAQSGSTGSLDLTIEDPDLLVTNIQFAEKTDAGAYGALATTWDRSAGTAGATKTLTRGEDIALADKHSVSIRWVVTYNDGFGAKTVEGAHSFDANQVAEVTDIKVTFDQNGEAVVTAIGDEDTANMYVTVGNGSPPSDPTSGANDGTISGRNGTVSTGVKITTGNDAFVKVVGYDSGAAAGPVRATQQARRTGTFFKSTSTSSHSGDTSETPLLSINVPGGTLGENGVFEATIVYKLDDNSVTESGTIRLKWGTAPVTIYTATLGPGTEVEMVRVIVANAGSVSSQKIVAERSQEVTPFHQIYVTTGSEDTSSGRSLVVTGQLSAGFVNIQTLVAFAEFKGTD